MELPHELKKLYRHWDHHTLAARKNIPIKRFRTKLQVQKQLEWFIRERMSIWKKKQSGEKPPFTKDPVLATYRFCNIFRELDRQTIAYHTLLNPLRENFPLWLLNMFYCRMVARPETVREVGLLSFDVHENKALHERFVSLPRPRYGTPYVFPVSVIQRSSTPTRETFITKYLPSAMPALARLIETWKRMPVADGVDAVLPLFSFNLKFLWTEVLIDVAYQYPERIDLFGRFPIGPGALPTFKRLSARYDPEQCAVLLGDAKFATDLTYKGSPLVLSAENWEGVGCEFRKYTNLKQGRGRKRRFASAIPHEIHK